MPRNITIEIDADSSDAEQSFDLIVEQLRRVQQQQDESTRRSIENVKRATREEISSLRSSLAEQTARIRSGEQLSEQEISKAVAGVRRLHDERIQVERQSLQQTVAGSRARAEIISGDVNASIAREREQAAEQIKTVNNVADQEKRQLQLQVKARQDSDREAIESAKRRATEIVAETARQGRKEREEIRDVQNEYEKAARRQVASIIVSPDSPFNRDQRIRGVQNRVERERADTEELLRLSSRESGEKIQDARDTARYQISQIEAKNDAFRQGVDEEIRQSQTARNELISDAKQQSDEKIRSLNRFLQQVRNEAAVQIRESRRASREIIDNERRLADTKEASIRRSSTLTRAESSEAIRQARDRTNAIIASVNNETNAKIAGIKRQAALDQQAVQEARSNAAEEERITREKTKTQERIERESSRRRERERRRLAVVGRNLAFTFFNVGDLASITRFVFDATLEIERLREALEALFGDAQLASQEFDDLLELARKPGISLVGAADAAIKLRAIGIEGEKAHEIIQELGNALALTAQPESSTRLLIRAIAQIEGRGKVQQEEINQLIEPAPILGQVLRRAFGSQNAEQIRAVTRDVDEFRERFVAELRKLDRAFEDSLQNTLDNFGIELRRLAAAFGDLVEPGTRRGLQDLTSLFREMADAIGNNINFLRDVFFYIYRFSGLEGVVLILRGVATGLSAIQNASASLIDLLSGRHFSRQRFLENLAEQAERAAERQRKSNASAATSFSQIGKALKEATEALEAYDKKQQDVNERQGLADRAYEKTRSRLTILNDAIRLLEGSLDEGSTVESRGFAVQRLLQPGEQFLNDVDLLELSQSRFTRTLAARTLLKRFVAERDELLTVLQTRAHDLAVPAISVVDVSTAEAEANEAERVFKQVLDANDSTQGDIVEALRNVVSAKRRFYDLDYEFFAQTESDKLELQAQAILNQDKFRKETEANVERSEDRITKITEEAFRKRQFVFFQGLEDRVRAQTTLNVQDVITPIVQQLRGLSSTEAGRQSIFIRLAEEAQQLFSVLEDEDLDEIQKKFVGAFAGTNIALDDATASIALYLVELGIGEQQAEAFARSAENLIAGFLTQRQAASAAARSFRNHADSVRFLNSEQGKLVRLVLSEREDPISAIGTSAAFAAPHLRTYSASLRETIAQINQLVNIQAPEPDTNITSFEDLTPEQQQNVVAENERISAIRRAFREALSIAGINAQNRNALVENYKNINLEIVGEIKEVEELFRNEIEKLGDDPLVEKFRELRQQYRVSDFYQKPDIDNIRLTLEDLVDIAKTFRQELRRVDEDILREGLLSIGDDQLRELDLSTFRDRLIEIQDALSTGDIDTDAARERLFLLTEQFKLSRNLRKEEEQLSRSRAESVASAATSFIDNLANIPADLVQIARDNNQELLKLDLEIADERESIENDRLLNARQRERRLIRLEQTSAEERKKIERDLNMVRGEYIKTFVSQSISSIAQLIRREAQLALIRRSVAGIEQVLTPFLSTLGPVGTIAGGFIAAGGLELLASSFHDPINDMRASTAGRTRGINFGRQSASDLVRHYDSGFNQGLNKAARQSGQVSNTTNAGHSIVINMNYDGDADPVKMGKALREAITKEFIPHLGPA